MKYLLALAFSIVFLFTATVPAVADEGDVTWSVRPGDENGEDGRSWVEWTADPEAVRTEHMVVTNHSATEVEFQLSSADGYFTENGRFNMLPSDQESVDAGTWIDLPESVVVPAGSSAVVPFTVTVPANATPGDHPAGVAASIHSPGAGTVGLESRVGFRVMTRVSGELVPQLALDVSGSYRDEVNPFESGALDIAYEVANTGNTRLTTRPEITIAGPLGLGAQSVQGEEILELAPGESRAGTARFSAAWPLFSYDLTVTADPLPVSDELSFDGAEQASGGTRIVAIPWSQLLTLVLGIALIIWTLWRRRRGRLRTERLIAEAREEALASVGVAMPTQRLSRRAVRSGTVAVALTLVCAGAIAVPAQHALAATEEPDSGSGVEVTVEISPRDDGGEESPATADQSEDPSTVLPQTGAEVPWGFALGAAALVVIGGAMTLRHRS